MMTAIIRSIYKMEESFDRKAEYFLFHHPFAAFWLIFLGMPLAILLIVSVSTVLLILLMRLLTGWY